MEHLVYYNMPIGDFKKWFNNFKNLVKNKKAKPLEYKYWKAIENFTKQNNLEYVLLSTDDDNFTKIVFSSWCSSLEIPLADFSLTGSNFRTYVKEKFSSMKIKMDNYNDNTATIAVNTDAIIGSCVKYDNTSSPTIADSSNYQDSIKYNGSCIAATPLTTWNTITLKTDAINNNTLEKKEEKKKMNNFKFDFGPVKNNNIIGMSMYGLAVKNLDGSWVSYNPTTNELIDVDMLHFDSSKFLYKIPVAIAEIAVGDIVLHMGQPVFVIDINEVGELTVINPTAGEKRTILPAKSIFNFNYYTKIVSLFNMSAAAPSTDAPFGNMLPFLMMDNDNMDMATMMLLMNSKDNNLTANPMMMYMLAKNDDMKDMLPLLLFNGMK